LCNGIWSRGISDGSTPFATAAAAVADAGTMAIGALIKKAMTAPGTTRKNLRFLKDELQTAESKLNG
jgi:hypothetical protein